MNGVANQRLRKWLAKLLRLAPGKIEIINGHYQRNKVLLLTVNEDRRAGMVERLVELAEN